MLSTQVGERFREKRIRSKNNQVCCEASRRAMQRLLRVLPRWWGLGASMVTGDSRGSLAWPAAKTGAAAVPGRWVTGAFESSRLSISPRGNRLAGACVRTGMLYGPSYCPSHHRRTC